MSDHCQNCTVRGDLEACRTVCERATSNPCDVPTSWGAASRIAELETDNTRLRDALEIATVSLTAKYPEDFRAVFTDSEILAMIDRHNKGADFKIEDVIRAALLPRETGK
jgi:hypothetical protein